MADIISQNKTVGSTPENYSSTQSTTPLKQEERVMPETKIPLTHRQTEQLSSAKDDFDRWYQIAQTLGGSLGKQDKAYTHCDECAHAALNAQKYNIFFTEIDKKQNGEFILEEPKRINLLQQLTSKITIDDKEAVITLFNKLTDFFINVKLTYGRISTHSFPIYQLNTKHADLVSKTIIDLLTKLIDGKKVDDAINFFTSFLSSLSTKTFNQSNTETKNPVDALPYFRQEAYSNFIYMSLAKPFIEKLIDADEVKKAFFILTEQKEALAKVCENHSYQLLVSSAIKIIVIEKFDTVKKDLDLIEQLTNHLHKNDNNLLIKIVQTLSTLFTSAKLLSSKEKNNSTLYYKIKSQDAKKAASLIETLILKLNKSGYQEEVKKWLLDSLSKLEEANQNSNKDLFTAFIDSSCSILSYDVIGYYLNFLKLLIGNVEKSNISETQKAQAIADFLTQNKDLLKAVFQYRYDNLIQEQLNNTYKKMHGFKISS